MANRYWVGGTATWDATAGTKWASTSGGAGGQSVPTAADDVFFDAASGAAVVTTSGTTVDLCNNLNFTGFTGTLSHASGTTITVSGSLTLVAGMTYTRGNTTSSRFIFNGGTTGKTIAWGGKAPGDITFNATGGGWTLSSAMSSGSTIYLTAGSLNTNGQAVTANSFSSNNSNVRSLILGATTMTLNENGSNTSLTFNTVTNLTLTPNTSTIVIAGASQVQLGTGLTFNNMTITGASVHFQTSSGGTTTFNNLTVTTPATTNQIVAFGASTSTTVVTGTFTVTGVNANQYRAMIFSNTATARATIQAAAVSLTNVDFQGIAATGAATWSGTSVGNATDNTGITFTTPVTRYWVGNGGNWFDTARWSASSGGASGASVPLCHDDVIFNASSITSAGQTITASNARLGNNITFSGVLNTPTVNWAAPQTNTTFAGPGAVYGNLTLQSAMTMGSVVVSFGGSNAQSINTNGVNMAAVVLAVTKRNSSVLSMASNFTTTGAGGLAMTAGEFDANDFNMTMSTVGGMSSGASATLRLGNGTWDLIGTGTKWGFTLQANLTVVPESSTIIVSDTTATSKTFDGDGLIYNTLRVTGDNVIIAGSSTYNTLEINTAGRATGLKITSGTTQNIRANVTTNGSVGNLAKLISSTAASAGTLNMRAARYVSLNYMSIQDSTVTGGLGWYAGANSTSVSNNTGWTFTAPPAVPRPTAAFLSVM